MRRNLHGNAQHGHFPRTISVTLDALSKASHDITATPASSFEISSQPALTTPSLQLRVTAAQAMSQGDESRFAMELELLQAMYPEQIAYDARSRDLKFSSEGALLELRIPESYPETAFPDVMGASDSMKNDLRERMRAAFKDLGLAEGEEALDAIVASFQSMLDADAAASQVDVGAARRSAASGTPAASKTVIIWLHHLLALSKRKLALSPAAISGVTKPGYPGIMLFSGPAEAVTEHVNTLKAENWQAFQVRYEEPELWEFEHGSGIREVETMAEVVKALQSQGRREEFLKAAGIK